MKLFSFFSLAFLTMPSLQAADPLESVSNSFFEVDFVGEETWDRDAATMQRISEISKSSIDYWEKLLAPNYAIGAKQSKITIDIQFKDISSTTVATANTNYVSLGLQKQESNGLYYNYATASMATLLHGQNVTETHITIEVNDNYTFYFGEDPSAADRYDFHTVLMHEITHGMGFAAYKFQVLSKGNITTNYFYDTPYDNLIIEGLKGASLTLGSVVTLGKTDYAIFNPEDGAPGSSFSHIDETSYPHSLMNPSFTGGEVYRELSHADFVIFQAMGLNIAPEPSTVILILSLSPILLRRRRLRDA